MLTPVSVCTGRCRLHSYSQTSAPSPVRRSIIPQCTACRSSGNSLPARACCSAPLRDGSFQQTQRACLRRHSGSSRRSVTVAAGEAAPEWTLDQIAGLGFGFLLLVTIYLALQVDVFVARAQRRELGLCVDCGGVNDPASCPQPNCPIRTSSANGGSQGS